MAQAAITYTQVGKATKLDSGNRVSIVKLAFGDGASTYGTGLAVSGASLGCPNALVSLTILGSDIVAGYLFKYDNVNKMLRIFQTGASTSAALAELGAGATPAAMDVYVEAIGY